MADRRIRHFTYYFRRMMKFYDLKAKTVPQVLFILLLVVSFGFRIVAQPIIFDFSIYLQQITITFQDILSSGNLNDSTVIEAVIEIQNSDIFRQIINLSLKIIGIVLLQQVLMMLISLFYLGGYLTDLESQSAVFSQYMRKFIKALPRLLVFNLLFYLAMAIVFGIVTFVLSMVVALLPVFYFALNFFVLLLPVGWFIIQIIFIFKDITLLDTRVSVFRNFKLSWQLSAGNRFILARNIFFIAFLNLVIGMVTVDSQLVSMFIISFLEVIILLVRQRLIALMYLSRTRKPKESTVQDGKH